MKFEIGYGTQIDWDAPIGMDDGWCCERTSFGRSAQYPPAGERFAWRAENEWPLARTQWTRFYLDAPDRALVPSPHDRGLLQPSTTFSVL
jgi:hypothetical protein